MQKTNKSKISACCEVKCNGEAHVISVTANGRIVLRNHPNLTLDRVVAELSGEKNRCLEIFDAWRCGTWGDRDTIPPSLNVPFSIRMDKARLRRMGRWPLSPNRKAGCFGGSYLLWEAIRG